MINSRLVERPVFEVLGKKTWISGQDNELFGRFWEQCRAEGLMGLFEQISGFRAGPQTHGVLLGISRVEQDPANRAFDYMIAIEKPEGAAAAGLERYWVPASQWVVFECQGQVPEALVEAEIYAFTQWLPASGFTHALAPEMEVYLPAGGSGSQGGCEFWLPITRKI
jgi:AraC family transcriptional regulator